jgi:hypothetical protein
MRAQVVPVIFAANAGDGSVFRELPGDRETGAGSGVVDGDEVPVPARRPKRVSLLSAVAAGRTKKLTENNAPKRRLRKKAGTVPMALSAFAP